MNQVTATTTTTTAITLALALVRRHTISHDSRPSSSAVGVVTRYYGVSVFGRKKPEESSKLAASVVGAEKPLGGECVSRYIGGRYFCRGIQAWEYLFPCTD